MSVDLAIHLGVHKTATTLVQRVLRNSEAGLERANTLAFSAHASRFDQYRPFRAAFTHVVNRMISDHYTGKAAKISSAHLSEATRLFRELMRGHQARRVIISDENLLGFPAGHHYRKQGLFVSEFYACSDLIASALFEVTKEFSPRLRIYMRQQSSLVPSLYSNSIGSLLYGKDIGCFVSELALETFRFDRLIHNFRAHFSDVSLATYENIKVRGVSEFLREFFEWSGCDGNLVEQRDEIVNQSLNDIQIDICHTLWKHGEVIAPRADFVRWVRRLPALPMAPSEKSKLPPEMYASLDSQFRDDLSYSYQAA